MLRSRYDMTRTFVALMTVGLMLVKGNCRSPNGSAVKEDFVAAGRRAGLSLSCTERPGWRRGLRSGCAGMQIWRIVTP